MSTLALFIAMHFLSIAKQQSSIDIFPQLEGFMIEASQRSYTDAPREVGVYQVSS
jgi:hypothetical protein